MNVRFESTSSGIAVGTHAPMMLVIDHHMEAALEQALLLAAEQGGFSTQCWAPGDPGLAQLTPSLIVAALSPGARRLPAAVLHLADEVFPGLPVVLFTSEPLVQPVINLHGGRLTLLGPPYDHARMIPHLRAAQGWRPSPPEVPTPPSVTPEAVAPPLVSDRVRLQELKHGRGMAAWLISDGGERIEVSSSAGLTALLSSCTLTDLDLEREVMPALAAWQDQPESVHQQRLLGARRARAWSTLVHLDLDGGRWLLAAPAGWPVRVISRQRLPAWWELSAQTEDEGVRVLTAEPGDVILASAPFPDLPEFAPELLAAAAEGGASSVIDHLAAAARSYECAVTAVAMELRS